MLTNETGGTSKRPHFQRMFADARQRKFDLVLFWSLDRAVFPRRKVTQERCSLQIMRDRVGLACAEGVPLPAEPQRLCLKSFSTSCAS